MAHFLVVLLLAVATTTFSETVKKYPKVDATQSTNRVVFDCPFRSSACGMEVRDFTFARSSVNRRSGPTSDDWDPDDADHQRRRPGFYTVLMAGVKSPGRSYWMNTAVMEANNYPSRKLAKSELLNTNKAVRACLSFSYYMWGKDVGTLSIRAGLKTGVMQSTFGQEKWKAEGDQGKQWYVAATDLDADRDFQVMFRVDTLPNQLSTEGQIAIDNIEIRDGPCIPTDDTRYPNHMFIFRQSITGEGEPERHTQTIAGTIKGIIGKDNLWPNKEIPYAYDSKFNAANRDIVHKVFNHINSKLDGCVQLKEVTKPSRNTPHVAISSDMPTCIGDTGYSGKRTTLNLHQMCITEAEVYHQAMHLFGFAHEHIRPDRDQYVRINSNNILPAYKFFFSKLQSDEVKLDGMPYDYDSILHPRNTAFSQNGANTIEKKSNADVKIGQANEMSSGDYAKIRTAYGCSPTNQPPPPPPPPPTPAPSPPTSNDCPTNVDTFLADIRGYVYNPVNPATNEYCSNAKHTWKFQGSSSQRIRFVIEQMELENSNECHADSVKIFHSHSSSGRHETFCSQSDTGKEVIVRDGRAMIVFTTDAARNDAGFKIQYFIEDDSGTGENEIVWKFDFENGYATTKARTIKMENLNEGVTKWNRRRGPSQYEPTGPQGDHTGGGFYIYVNSRMSSSGVKSRIRTPLIQQSDKATELEFWYHMKGDTIGTLRIYAQNLPNTENQQLWIRKGAQGEGWNKGTVRLTGNDRKSFMRTGSFYVVFENTQIFGYKGDVALDDVALLTKADRPTPPTPRPTRPTRPGPDPPGTNPTRPPIGGQPTETCDFDNGLRSCGFQAVPQGRCRWSTNQGMSHKAGGLSGPGGAYRTKSYAHVDSQNCDIGQKVDLVSTNYFEPSSNFKCLEWRYNLYGYEQGCLEVWLFTEKSSRPDNQAAEHMFWKGCGNHGEMWLRSDVNLEGLNVPYKIRFRAIMTGKGESNVAVDEVKIWNKSCGESSSSGETGLPSADLRTCTFNTRDECGWYSDQPKYIVLRKHGKAPTPGTGPNGDYDDKGQGSYILMESTYGTSGDRSYQIDGPNIPKGMNCFSFYYNMNGAGVERLELNVITKNRRKRNIWRARGNQGSRWHNGQVTVDSSWLGMEFNMVKGRRQDGDIGLDYFQFYKHPGKCTKRAKQPVEDPILLKAKEQSGADVKATEGVNCTFTYKEGMCQWEVDEKDGAYWKLSKINGRDNKWSPDDNFLFIATGEMAPGHTHRDGKTHDEAGEMVLGYKPSGSKVNDFMAVVDANIEYKPREIAQGIAQHLDKPGKAQPTGGKAAHYFHRPPGQENENPDEPNGPTGLPPSRRVISPWIWHPYGCLEVQYHLNGWYKDLADFFNVYIKTTDNHERIVGTFAGNTVKTTDSSTWKRFRVDLYQFGRYKIILEMQEGFTYHAHLALDNIWISPRDCDFTDQQ